MKHLILLSSIVIFICSCQTPKIPKEELKWNYELIDRIVNNPDSLHFFLNNQEYTSLTFHSFNKEFNDMALIKLGNMVIQKLKDNDFKSGYSITDEKYEDKSYFRPSYRNISPKEGEYKMDPNEGEYIIIKWHSLLIKCNKTGKRVFFMFRCLGKWYYLFDIHTFILSENSILEY